MSSARRNFLFANSIRAVRTGVAAGLLLTAAACNSGDRAADVPPQKWKDMEVSVESRPSPPRAGMDEFLVMVTDGRGRPAYNLLVSLRTSDQNPWIQAIEDGQIGVYRRAVKVAPGTNSVLQVQIRRKDAEDVLYFPLKLQP